MPCNLGRSAWCPTGYPVAAAAYPGGVDEAELRPLDPRVVRVWRIGWTLAAAPAVAAAVAAELLGVSPLPTPALSVLVGLLGAVAVVVVPAVEHRRWRYALREHDLLIRHGLLTVTTSVIPYRRLQFVDTRRGPLDRLFGLARLVVHTAAPGTSGTVPGLDVATAEALRERLAAVGPDGDDV